MTLTLRVQAPNNRILTQTCITNTHTKIPSTVPNYCVWTLSKTYTTIITMALGFWHIGSCRIWAVNNIGRFRKWWAPMQTPISYNLLWGSEKGAAHFWRPRYVQPLQKQKAACRLTCASRMSALKGTAVHG